jgi:hypothetical protein
MWCPLNIAVEVLRVAAGESAPELSISGRASDRPLTPNMRTVFFFLHCLAAASAFMPAAIQQPAASVRRASGLAMEVGQNYVVRVEIELEQGEP